MYVLTDFSFYIIEHVVAFTYNKQILIIKKEQYYAESF